MGCQKTTTVVDPPPAQVNSSSPESHVDYSKADVQNIIDQIWNRLKTEHILFVLHKDKVPQIEANYLRIRESVPDAGLSEEDMLKTGWAILHPFHDMHLFLSPTKPQKKEFLFLSDLIVRELMGASLVSVNGESLDDILKRTDEWQIYESKSGAKSIIENELITDVGFTKYGYDLNNLNIVIQNADGKTETLHYSAADFNQQNRHRKALKKVPADLLDDRSIPWVVEIHPEQKLAVLTLRQCLYNDEYKAMLRQLFTDIKDKGIEHLILDLRNNQGGNSLVANEFITYLDIDRYLDIGTYIREGESYKEFLNMMSNNQKKADLTFHGKVYVLSSNKTFSSGVIFLNLLQDNHLATVIGESPNNLINTYGHVISKQLDGYPYVFMTTFKYFVRANGDLENSSIIPDIPCHASRAMEEAKKLMAQ